MGPAAGDDLGDLSDRQLATDRRPDLHGRQDSGDSGARIRAECDVAAGVVRADTDADGRTDVAVTGCIVHSTGAGDIGVERTA